MNLKEKRIRKIFIFIRLLLCGNGYKKAKYLKEQKVFKMFGENNYWFPKIIPADPEMVIIHNNVKIATDVYFCTHDILHNLFNDDKKIIKII